MLPPHGALNTRSTSPPRMQPGMGGGPGHYDDERLVVDPMSLSTMAADYGAEKGHLAEELRRKDAVLKQLEVQFELYKVEHAKLLASKLEEQREAFNLEKDRINQHFIKTGQELHGKTEELATNQQDAAKLQNENELLKQWLDRGVEECRRVAEENEKMKSELWEAKSQVSRNEADVAQRFAQLEMEKDRERGEREGALTALNAAQERIRELEVTSDEDKRNFMEIATQGRRMRRRLNQMRTVIDRFTGEQPADPLAVLEGDELEMENPDAASTVPDRQNARDALFHLHESLNNLQASCRILLQADPALIQALQQHSQGVQAPSLQFATLGSVGQGSGAGGAEVESLQNKLRRKNEEIEELEEERAHAKRRADQQREELEEELDTCRRARNALQQEADTARSESNRMHDDNEQNRLTLQRLQEQDEHARNRAQALEDELRKLTMELAQIRDYGLQLEEQNNDLQRQKSQDVLTGNRDNNLQEQINAQAHRIAELEQANRQLQEMVAALTGQPSPALLPGSPAVMPSQQPAAAQSALPATVVPSADSAPLKMIWPVDPDDFGHSSAAHPKLTCPLCGTTGFVPGIPCRSCGHSVGQFTRLVQQPSYVTPHQSPVTRQAQSAPLHTMPSALPSAGRQNPTTAQLLSQHQSYHMQQPPSQFASGISPRNPHLLSQHQTFTHQQPPSHPGSPPMDPNQPHSLYSAAQSYHRQPPSHADAGVSGSPHHQPHLLHSAAQSFHHPQPSGSPQNHPNQQPQSLYSAAQSYHRGQPSHADAGVSGSPHHQPHSLHSAAQSFHRGQPSHADAGVSGSPHHQPHSLQSAAQSFHRGQPSHADAGVSGSPHANPQSLHSAAHSYHLQPPSHADAGVSGSPQTHPNQQPQSLYSAAQSYHQNPGSPGSPHAGRSVQGSPHQSYMHPPASSHQMAPPGSPNPAASHAPGSYGMQQMTSSMQPASYGPSSRRGSIPVSQHPLPPIPSQQQQYVPRNSHPVNTSTHVSPQRT